MRSLRGLTCSTALAMTLVSPVGAGVDGKLVEGTMAKPIRRVNPKYPSWLVESGGEGWVQLNVVIARDGTTRDIVIEDSQGGAWFEQNAVRAVEKWIYEPATLGGKPVEQCHAQVIFTFKLEQPDDERGARRSFIRRFESIARALREGDTEAAKAALAELEPKNLYEGAYRSVLVASLADRDNDTAAQLVALRRATIEDGAYLPLDLYRGALLSTFQLEANQGSYASALATYRKLSELELTPEQSGALEAWADKITSLVDGQTRLVRQGVLGPRREGSDTLPVWLHPLSRSIVGLEDIEGKVDHVELRCDFHRAATPPKPGTVLRIPEKWGACHYLVFGEPGTRFRLIEYAESEFGS